MFGREREEGRTETLLQGWMHDFPTNRAASQEKKLLGDENKEQTRRHKTERCCVQFQGRGKLLAAQTQTQLLSRDDKDLQKRQSVLAPLAVIHCVLKFSRNERGRTSEAKGNSRSNCFIAKRRGRLEISGFPRTIRRSHKLNIVSEAK